MCIVRYWQVLPTLASLYQTIVASVISFKSIAHICNLPGEDLHLESSRNQKKKTLPNLHICEDLKIYVRRIAAMQHGLNPASLIVTADFGLLRDFFGVCFAFDKSFIKVLILRLARKVF